jgi:hypothetical protein
MKKPRPSPAGPEKKSLYAMSAHAKYPWFTRSRWTEECRAATSWWPCD